MLQHQTPSFGRHMIPLVALAIGGWAIYLWVFQHFFPDDYNPADGRGVLFAWIVIAALAFVGIQQACFVILKTPKHWWSAGSIALLAPALCLDAMATTFFHDLFDAGPHEDTAYAASVLAGVGVMQLVALVTGTPGRSVDQPAPEAERVAVAS